MWHCTCQAVLNFRFSVLYPQLKLLFLVLHDSRESAWGPTVVSNLKKTAKIREHLQVIWSQRRFFSFPFWKRTTKKRNRNCHDDYIFMVVFTCVLTERRLFSKEEASWSFQGRKERGNLSGICCVVHNGCVTVVSMVVNGFCRKAWASNLISIASHLISGQKCLLRAWQQWLVCYTVLSTSNYLRLIPLVHQWDKPEWNPGNNTQGVSDFRVLKP